MSCKTSPTELPSLKTLEILELTGLAPLDWFNEFKFAEKPWVDCAILEDVGIADRLCIEFGACNAVECTTGFDWIDSMGNRSSCGCDIDSSMDCSVWKATSTTRIQFASLCYYLPQPTC